MLSAPNLLSGAAYCYFEELDSTSLEARRLLARGEDLPVWIATGNQTAGYGRRGTNWAHARGNLAATFLFRPNKSIELLPQLSFVAALALSDALKVFMEHGQVTLKWPNDVLLDSQKVGGLLLELHSFDGEPVVALGCGVNILSHPNISEYKTCRLADFCFEPPVPLGFLEIVDAKFTAILDEWKRNGFAPIRKAWLEQAHGIGEDVTIRLHDREAAGKFRDIADDGSLVVETATGLQNYAAGAVFFQAGL